MPSRSAKEPIAPASPAIARVATLGIGWSTKVSGKAGRMDTGMLLSRQGDRMIQVGIALFVFTALEGFVVPALPVPRLGLSVHTLAALEGTMALGFGLVWTRLGLRSTGSRIAFWAYLCSSFATLVAYVLAAIWGAGSTTIPLAAGTAHGSAFQEMLIKVVLYPAAPTFLISTALVVWGLRLSVARLPRAAV